MRGLAAGDHRKVLLALPYPVLIHTIDTNVFANLETAQVLDAAMPDALVGLPVSSLSHTDNQAAGAERRRLVIEHRTTVTVPLKLVTLEGRICRMTARATPVSCAGEDYIVVMGAVHEYTDDVERAPETERAAVDLPESLFEAALEALPLGCVVHTDEKIVYANEAARRLFGRGTDQPLAGLTIADTCHPDGLESANQRTRFVLDTDRVVCDVPLKLIAHDGSTFPVKANGRSVDSSAGRVVVVVFLPDES